jgi:hypothetical protein
MAAPRSWRSWSDVAQRAILAYMLVDLAAYGWAALPGGTSWDQASLGSVWLVIDGLLFWRIWRGSRLALGTSFAIALLPPVSFALTLLPIAAIEGAHTSNVAYNLVFCLPEVVLLGIAMGCEDRDQDAAPGALPA